MKNILPAPVFTTLLVRTAPFTTVKSPLAFSQAQCTAEILQLTYHESKALHPLPVAAINVKRGLKYSKRENTKNKLGCYSLLLCIHKGNSSAQGLKQCREAGYLRPLPGHQPPVKGSSDCRPCCLQPRQTERTGEKQNQR